MSRSPFSAKTRLPLCKGGREGDFLNEKNGLSLSKTGIILVPIMRERIHHHV
jgi:hypothetical protein